MEEYITLTVPKLDFNKSYLESQNRLLTDSTKKLAEEKEKSESRYFDTRSELETTRTDLRQEVNKNKANQQVIKDLKAQIANLMLNKKSETASLEYFSPSKTLLSELSSLEDQQKEITLLEKTVEGLNKQVSDQTARADDLEQQLVRYQQGMPQDEDDSDDHTQNLQPIVKGLSRLFTKEDKLAIPTFSGKDTDGLVTAWLREAETLGTLHKRDPEEKTRYFSQRLRGEAADWLEEYLRDYSNCDYDFWKASIIERFQNESDIEQLKNSVQHLTQAPGQRTKSFIAKINGLYDDAYGKERPLGRTADQESKI